MADKAFIFWKFCSLSGVLGEFRMIDTYDAVVELADNAGQRGCAADLSYDHCAVFRSKNPGFAAISHGIAIYKGLFPFPA